MVSLGDQKLIDQDKGKKAREASRRVEITVSTAKPLTASATGANKHTSRNGLHGFAVDRSHLDVNSLAQCSCTSYTVIGGQAG